MTRRAVRLLSVREALSGGVWAPKVCYGSGAGALTTEIYKKTGLKVAQR